jgi:hypothetical protein
MRECIAHLRSYHRCHFNQTYGYVVHPSLPSIAAMLFWLRIVSRTAAQIIVGVQSQGRASCGLCLNAIGTALTS